jgi:TolB-like protein/class 3 adenylate cyclase
MSDISGNPRVSRKLVAILAADIAGYSALMGADEEATVQDLKAHQSVILPMIPEHGGRVIDTAGDGILAEFASVLNAVQCAVAVQKTMADRNTAIDPARRMQFRIGINQGDVIFDEARVYGDGINIAARLEGIAEPGGICLSGKVYDEIQGRVDLTCEDLGAQQLKNIERPVRAYRILLNHFARFVGELGEGAAIAVPVHLSEATAGPAPALPDKPSIAVMPFANLSGDPQQEYFADGVVEEIITSLSRIRWLFVIARNSSFAYKGRAVDVKQVGRDLGVRYVLEGSIRKSGNRIRVTGQLIDASAGMHLWADRFDSSLEDLFELQDEVTASVVGAIAPKLERAEIERASCKPTERMDAYDFFLRGMASLHKFTRKDTDIALDLFHRALELDQEFASAYAMASLCHTRRKAQGWIAHRPQEVSEGARLARQATKFGREDANALAFAGFTLAYLAWELEDGAAYVDQAVSLNANHAPARDFSGWVKVWLGEPELALEQFDYAMRLSPVDPFIYLMLHGSAHALFFAGRFDEAIERALTALRDHPDHHGALRIAVASCASAGRTRCEVGSMLARLRNTDTTLRVSNLRNKLGPYRNRKHVLIYEDALRQAGLPE